MFIIVLSCIVAARAQNHSIQEVAGISRDILVLCRNNNNSCSGARFWIITGAVYGLLHLPEEFVVCSSRQSCNHNDLSIPVITRELNGSTFQCAQVDYYTATEHLGGITQLTVVVLQSKNCTNTLHKGLYYYTQIQWKVTL